MKPYRQFFSEVQPREKFKKLQSELCAVAESILKNDKLASDQSTVKVSREIVLSGANSPSPEFDPKYHLPFELPSWGSPLPRIESAQGLSHYLWNWGLDADVVKVALRLAEDKVPAVRYQIAEGLASRLL